MIRPAAPEDAPAMLEVMFSTTMSKESTWWTTTVDDLVGRLTEGGGFVAVEDGRIVGTVLHVREVNRLILRSLAVRPEVEGRGVGTALVAAVEAHGRNEGVSEILLAVSASNLDVCVFYRRLGYVDSTEPYAHATPGRPAPAVFVKPLRRFGASAN